MTSNPLSDSSEPEQRHHADPPVPWWVAVLLITIAVGAYVILVVFGKQDGGSTAGSLGALLTGLLVVLGIGRRR
ncbi:hypothetical protein [Streptomyces jumonjinensis]|uniref:Uncharacterized protein n=1 Tax=Streptomyces jumonjinensis TaxID=1945 RepID=A0A646KMB5_STRJU|nr:hypothetical protein [Streptomyces jumonjinensis]MQT03355.1 hypothetical protein [Streptomyces jumonjinensis]